MTENLPMPIPTHQKLTDDERRERGERHRIDAIKEKMRLSPMTKESDRLTVAKNLWRILVDLEERSPPIPKSAVLHAADQGGEGDSTKRLPKFAVNPDLSEDEQERRSKNLTKKIEPFTKIARAAATLSGRDEHAFLARLVKGTGYDSIPSVSSNDDVSHPLDDISTFIQEVTLRISNKYNLHRCFYNIRQFGIGGPPHILLSNLSFTHSRVYESLRNTSLPAVVFTEDLPPRPCIFLGEMQAHFDLRCEISLDLNNSFLEDHEEELNDRCKNAGIESVTLVGRAKPVQLVWLDLLPLGERDQIVPVLRITSKTYILAGEESGAYTAVGSSPIREGALIGEFWGPIEPGIISVDNMYADAGGVLDDETDTYIPFEVSALFDEELDNSYVDSDHCKIPQDYSLLLPFDRLAMTHHLSKRVSPFKYKPVAQRFCVASANVLVNVDPGFGNEKMSWREDNTLAAAFVRSLFDVPEPARLDRLLDTAARTLAEFISPLFDKERVRRRRRLEEWLGEYPETGPASF